MARKEIDITISDEGRDQGKIYHIKEMPAMQAEKWALKALMAAAKAGVDVGEMGKSGIAGVAMLGIEALMRAHFEDIEPLLDEMMLCISVKPDRANPNIVRALISEDIEEIATFITLRAEVLKLHMGFSNGGARQTQSSMQAPTAPLSSHTPTFQDQSAPFSQSPKAKRTR